MNLLKHDQSYSIEVFPHGILVTSAGTRNGVPMDALSTATKLCSPSAVMDAGIASSLGAVFAIGIPSNLKKWRKQIEEQLKIGNIPKDIQWIRGTDIGLSSTTLFLCLTKCDQAKHEPAAFRLLERGEKHHPYDADDFGRCIRMVEFCGFTDLREAKHISPQWFRLIVDWDELSKAYHNKDLTTVNAIVKECVK